jgi:hypothetical protein
MLIGVAACTSGTGGSAGAPQTARKALLATASRTRQVNSAVETLTVHATGAQSVTTTGVVQFRRSPTPLIGEELDATADGKTTQLKAVLTGTAFYLSEPTLTSQLGKPWMKIDLSGQKNNALGSISQLMHSLQGNDFLNLTHLFAVAKNARIVGKQTIDGVATTEYAGTFHADAALKALSPAYRKVLAPQYRALGNTSVSFHVWIDGQHYTRKATTVETINGETINTTVIVKAINQPVHIVIPPASQTATPPGA